MAWYFLSRLFLFWSIQVYEVESFATETGGTPEPRPFFEDPESNITVQLGAQVYMHCRVQNLQDTLKVNSHFSSFSRHFFPLIPHSPVQHHLYNLAMYSERRFLGRFSKNLKKKKKKRRYPRYFRQYSLSRALSLKRTFCRKIFPFVEKFFFFLLLSNKVPSFWFLYQKWNITTQLQLLER